MTSPWYVWVGCGVVAAGFAAWCVAWRLRHRRARGVVSRGAAPAGSREFLTALCSVMGWSGVVVEWRVGRIPIGSEGKACDADTPDSWTPRILCRSDADWRALLAHEAGHVELGRAGRSGEEPTPARTAEIVHLVATRLG